VAPAPARRRLSVEIWIVLGLSLGQSGVYAVVSLIAKLTAEGGLRASTATLNASRSDRPHLDLVLQLLGIGFALVPVALALYLLAMDPERSPLRRLGLDRSRPARDLMWGAALAALIGIPGLGLYAVGRMMGVTADVVPSALDAYWWTVPVLVLAAVQNAVLEEVVVVGYLMTRLKQLGWTVWPVIIVSALVRGGYHLYQGVGQGMGNVIMGLVFGYWFHRTGRVGPLIVAHTIMDVVVFVGYSLFAERLGLR